MFRNSPFCLFRWSKELNPSGQKPTTCPVWVELPNLPFIFYPWIKKITEPLGKVLGTRPKSTFNPSWHPQVLVEVDLALPLVEEIAINCGEFNIK